MEKLLFFDVETTGLKHWENGLHQIAGAVVIGGQIKEFFDFKASPYATDVIEQSALDVSGLKAMEIMKYPDPRAVLKEFDSMVTEYVDVFDKKDKFFLVGYNVHFDVSFLREFYRKGNEKYFGSRFWSNPIDVMVLASHRLMAERLNMLNFKQGTVAKHLGIEVDDEKLHDAAYDTQILIEIYNKIK